MTVRKLFSDVSGGLQRRASQRLRFGGRFAFDDRRRNADTAVIVLAGFKDYLWPYTLRRIARFAPPGADVCLVSAGLHSNELASLAARNDWSYLATRTRRVATAQNIAIREHGDATWIYKVDEDVFVTQDCFEHVLEGYRRIAEEGVFEPGFVAPILNVNGFSYVPFLEALGLLDEYAREFDGTPRACTRIPIQADGSAAAWVWRHSVPLDEVARRFSTRSFGYSTIPHRFSTGLVLFRRDLWTEIEGFRATVEPPGVGEDEADFCMQCVSRSRVMLVVHNALAGHYSFGPQEATMRAMLDELTPGLELQ